MSSTPKKPLKIKVLPKKEVASQKPRKSAPRLETRKKKFSKNTNIKMVFLGLALVAVFGLYFVNSGHERGSESLGNEQPIANKKLTRYLQDGVKKSELKSLEVQVENTRALNEELPAFLPLDEEGPEQRQLGVELESDPSIARVYDDLYGASPNGKWMTPEERISARLAEKKWLYNYEKEEKKMYIRNFIEAAKNAGYEIKINEDLIVTHVRPITNKPKIPLDKVIENLQFSK